MKRLTAFIVAIAALAAAFASSGPAQAQSGDFSDRPPIDLAVEFDEETRVTRSYFLRVVVTNNSEVPVNNVVVNFEHDPPAVDTFRHSAGSFANGKWTIPQIGPGEQERLGLYRREGRRTDTRFFFRARASLASSSPKETPGLEYNNRAEIWAAVYTGRTGVGPSVRGAFGEVGMQVAVDNLRPALDGQAVFKVIAKNTRFVNRGIAQYWNKTGVQVKVTLSTGLSFASSNLSNTTISGNTAIWRAGDLLAARNDARRTKTLSIPVNLSGSAPLERRCLTAEVFQVTPPDREENRFDDVAVACLGDGPLERFSSGSSADLFTFFPCIGVTTYPCSTDDTLELVTEVLLEVPGNELRQRRRDSAPNPSSSSPGRMYLQPESVFLHVDDRMGRGERDGSVIWSTWDVMDLRDSQYHLPAGWRVQEAVTVTAPGGGDAPGRWLMAGDLGGHDLTDFLDATDSSKATIDPWDVSGGSDPIDSAIQFWALGTYKALFEITGTVSGATYTDSGTYIFHVGPVAELEVRDAGASPEAARDERAYTIEAVNNGPDAVSAAVVTVASAPEGARVVASQGSYTQGVCQDGLCEGVWTIGELAAPETVPLSGRSASATLAVIAEDGVPASVTATIESARDYTICIDGDGVDVDAASESACEAGGNSWHSAEYYDDITYNNTARIASHAGTGEGHPDAPSGVRVMETSVANILIWQPPETVNGHEVTHYEVQRSASPWTTLADDVRGMVYVDLDLRPGQLMQYRVRAVNRFGIPGPWSFATTTGPDAPGDFTAEQLQGGEVRLTWTKPDGNGAAITGYTIHVSTNGGQSWSNTGAQLGADDTGWTHGNLSVGPVRLYRIQARTANGPGAWAQATSASIAAPSITADYDGSSDILLTWTMPGGNAVPVLSWELEHSTDGASWSRLATVRAADGMSYTHRGLSPGAFRHYRVRAGTALGHGPWSDAATATTAAGAPRLTATANGPNEIVLTWAKPSGDAEIFEYRLERNTAGSDWSHLASVYPDEGTTYVDGGLSPGATWSYRVRAVSIADGNLLDGDWSAEVSATTDSGGPEAPKDPAAVADGENVIKLSWTEPADNGSPITGYRIEHSTDGGVTWALLRARHSGATYSHTGLLSGTTHHYRVAAINRNGRSEFSSVASATTAGTETTVPGMPKDLRVTGVDRDRVSIAWGPPDDDGGTRVTGYEYRYLGPCANSPADLCEGDVKTTGGTQATVSGLKTAGEYRFEVRAVNAVGAGEWSDPVYADVVPATQGRVIVTPASLTLTEGGSATYRVKLSHEPTQPIAVSLFWDDPNGVLDGNELAGQQQMLLLPSGYAPPEGAEWDGWAFRWDVGVPITVVAGDDEVAGGGGTAVIHHDVWTAPPGDLGNPPDWAEDPVYHGMTGPGVKVTVRDND